MCSTDHRGFTLLEVMIALAIVAIALLSCLGLANRCIASHAQVRHITTATLLAQHKMSEIEALATQRQLDQQDDSGTWEAPFDLYQWQVSFSTTPLPQVRQVRVSVRWGDPARNEEVRLDSFVLD
ncbi:MAG: type II secretion system minor pseudopilin GspI [Desulfuromonas sp.]|jgi:general secretion pathway protein I|nr:type II secretion system minor pseudopilin GspI [Desulfuromonas thiophila]MDD3800986.1 type II secretion system minor pseudopilin GspI [Desulfuromonas thiophila]